MTDPSKTSNLHKYLHGFRGRLYKQGHVFKNWRQRYFVLEKKKLKYYADESLGKVNGEYTIDDNTEIYDIPGDSDGQKYLFYLRGKNASAMDDILYLSASSAQEKAEWIEAIYDAVHNGFKVIDQKELIEPFYPITEMSIEYVHHSVCVENGNVLKPSQVDRAPIVSYRTSNPGDKYCLVLIDFDAVMDVDETQIMLHWGVVDIPGCDISGGNEVSETIDHHYVGGAVDEMQSYFNCIFHSPSSTA